MRSSKQQEPQMNNAVKFKRSGSSRISNPWLAYEREKRRLLTLDLTPEQYEEAVCELTKRLKI